MTEVGLRERKKAATRERIVTAAIDLWSARGMEAVTVEEIAAAADVGKGTVYNYFRAKEDVVVAFLVALDSKALEGVPALADQAGDLADVLNEAALRILEAKADHHAFVRAFFARLFASEGFLAELGDVQTTLDRGIGGLLERLQANGRIGAGVDIPAAIFTFKTLHLGLSALWALEGPPYAGARAQCRIQMRMLARELAP
jgi:AcrR family transcriptional regulator